MKSFVFLYFEIFLINKNAKMRYDKEKNPLKATKKRSNIIYM